MKDHFIVHLPRGYVLHVIKLYGTTWAAYLNRKGISLWSWRMR